MGFLVVKDDDIVHHLLEINSQSGSHDEDVTRGFITLTATPSAARGEDGVVNLQNVTNSYVRRVIYLNTDRLNLAALRPTLKTKRCYSICVPSLIIQTAEQQFAHYVPGQPAGGI